MNEITSNAVKEPTSVVSPLSLTIPESANEPDQPTPTRLVKATLLCRRCGVAVERTLSLLGGAKPPKYFECAKCTGDRSMFDGLTLDEILDLAAINWVARHALIAELSGYEEYPTTRDPRLGHGGEFDYINGYAIYRKAQTQRASRRWRKRNQIKPRVYKRQYRSTRRARWLELVEQEFSWRCFFCKCELNPKTIRCFCSVPACRSCVAKESAKPLSQRVAEAKSRIASKSPREEEPTSGTLFASSPWPSPPGVEQRSIKPLLEFAKKVKKRPKGRIAGKMEAAA